MPSDFHRTADYSIQILMPENAVRDALLILQSYSCFEYRIEEFCVAYVGSTRGPSQHNDPQGACVVASAKCHPAYLTTLVDELQARFGTSIAICTETYSYNAIE